MADFLFSYGTLQPGLAPAEIERVVRRFRLVGRAYIHGLLYDFGEYPGAVMGGTEEKVWGLVMALPDDPDVLRRLDEYEEYDPSNIEGSQYIRRTCTAALDSGEAVESWVYFYNRDVSSATLISSGEFLKSRG
jgi:gamma-glutamylcyclotransferase (GGCT)/AIG2-like uncharacterized protein YtfP